MRPISLEGSWSHFFCLFKSFANYLVFSYVSTWFCFRLSSMRFSMSSVIISLFALLPLGFNISSILSFLSEILISCQFSSTPLLPIDDGIIVCILSFISFVSLFLIPGSFKICCCIRDVFTGILLFLSFTLRAERIVHLPKVFVNVLQLRKRRLIKIKLIWFL